MSRQVAGIKLRQALRPRRTDRIRITEAFLIHLRDPGVRILKRVPIALHGPLCAFHIGLAGFEPVGEPVIYSGFGLIEGRRQTPEQ